MKLISIFAVLVTSLILNVKIVSAERVLITAENGEIGHGWVFGSTGYTSGSCWVVAPLHVINDNGNNARPFTYTDINGMSRIALNPIDVNKIVGLAEIVGTDDLAFSLIESRAGNKSCLSRLGLNSYEYNNLIRSNPDLTVYSMFTSSYKIINLKIYRAGSASFDGKFLLEPTDKNDAIDFVKSGLSGSVAEVKSNYGPQPIAMILNLENSNNNHLIKAIRFDKINTAFQLVEKFYVNNMKNIRAKTSGIPYKILNFSGILLNPAINPYSLNNNSSCLEIAPAGGKKTVSITIELEDNNEKISEIILKNQNNCGKDYQKYSIDQRISDSSDWDRVVTCESISDKFKPSKKCNMDLNGPRQLRITCVTNSKVGFSELKIQ
nr:hypothetical protein [uncultured Desulfobulbus sp.]